LNGHGSGEMKSPWPVDPRLRKLPCGISITTSTSGGSAAASGAGDGLRFASFIPQPYLNPADSTNGISRRAGRGALCRAGNYYAAPRRLDRKMKLLSKREGTATYGRFRPTADDQ